MEQFIYPTLTAFFAALIAYFFAKRKNTADAKSAEIDNEIKSAEFFRGLLDEATRRLNEAIDTINRQDLKIKSLMIEIELLTDELKKFKQLNGKTSH